jgi:tetratricopeptide (TPR) repeat protein
VALTCEPGSIDAVAFRDRARAATNEQCIADALAIWRGSPLADVEVSGQQAFQAWIAAERDALTALRTNLLKAAVDRVWECPEAALAAARRLVAIEPWNEWGHARVVQLLERCGRTTEAAAYEAATRRSLCRELGIAEAKLLTPLPPPPVVPCKDETRLVKRTARPVVQLEPLKVVPRGDYFAGLGAQITSWFGAALWRNRSCDVLDEEGAARSDSGDRLEADFAVRGVVVQREGGAQIALRCVNLRRGTVLWSGQTDVGSSFGPNPCPWVEASVEAVVAAIRTAVLELDDTVPRHYRLMTARSLAGALQPAANQQALCLLNEILADHPDEPDALALTAWCHAQRAVYNWSANADQDRCETRYYAAIAMRTGADDAECLTAIATARTLVADRNGAEALLDRALRLDSEAPGAHMRSGWLANYSDDPVRALRHFGIASRLARLDPASFNTLTGLGVAYFIQGDHAQAIRRMEQALALNPQAIWIYRNLVPAYVAAGERQKAEDGIGALVTGYPGLTVAAVCDAMVFSPSVQARIAEGLHCAGLARA